MRLSQDTRIGALAGFVATAALAGVLYLLAQLQALSFIPLDIAEAINHLTPGQIATEGIEALGSLAKTLVEISGVVFFLLAGTVAGVLVARQRAYTSASSGLLVGLAGLLLTVLMQSFAGRFPDMTTLGVTALVLFGWGFVLVMLLRRALGTGATPAATTEAAAAAPDRRAFLRRSGGVLLTVAVGSTAVGELLRRAEEEHVAQQATSGNTAMPGAALPAPGKVAAEPGAGAGVVPDAAFVPGVGARPELTPNDKLYIIGTTTRSPRIDASQWRLVIKGMVDQPISLSYDELRALPRMEQISTLTCISNEVGGDLIGNITWSGTRLRDLLQQAGVQAGAVDVVLRSNASSYSDSIPLQRALNPQNLIAYGMNEKTLAIDHGFPARLIVPGIYGMKNVKWLEEIEVVGEDYQGFWEVRGWDDTAIVKTQATIDTGNPELRNDDSVKLENGKLVLGGYAFAGERGLAKVEVRVDGGEWQAAQLKQPTSKLTWREWRYEWPAAPGRHTVSVRATDGEGQLQTADSAPPHPDGASGWHTLEINVVG